MQTFQVNLGVDIRAVITKEFLAECRKEAQAEEATPFLKEAQARFSDDDDQFMLAIVCNAFRTFTRQSLLDFMLKSGVGGTVAPVKIIDRICAVPKAFSETAPSDDIDKPLKPTTLTLGFDPGIPAINPDANGKCAIKGCEVQHLVEAQVAVPPSRIPCIPEKLDVDHVQIFQDGDKVCALLGEDLQSGVAGFGDTEEEAREDLAENLRK